MDLLHLTSFIMFGAKEHASAPANFRKTASLPLVSAASDGGIFRNKPHRELRMLPHEYPRRILLCVTGLRPQIATETLYALAVETHGAPAFVPTEFRLIGTAVGVEQARLSLLAKDRDQFGKLCREYGLTGIQFNESMIETVTDASGKPLSDILTPADNEAAADAITRLIASLTSDPDAAVHVSIAGGRKSMGFFAGYALSLYGRPQDRLSHVMVSERFEGHPEFYFKPKVPVTLQDKDKLDMSTDQADIRLAEIPFIPFREGQHLPLLEGRAGYVETVRSWRRSSGDGVLLFDPARCRISWQGVSLKLSPTQFGIYAALAEMRRRADDEGWIAHRRLYSDKDYQRRFIEAATRICGAYRPSEALEEAFWQEQNRPNGGKRPPVAQGPTWLFPHISRINTEIMEVMDELTAKRIGIEAGGKRNDRLYRLALAPEFVRAG